jgi:3-phosphoshikimate 1-carboxyvinyltransferase
MITVSHPTKIISADIDLPASKSVSNRLLVIHFLMGQSFKINHLSACDDTNNLQKALAKLAVDLQSNTDQAIVVDIGEAGTSFRFLTAMLTIIPGKFILTGSKRLLERPIQPLVDAMQQLGASISYENKHPGNPLLINHTLMQGGEIELDAGVSSQFVSALMLIAPYFKKGLVIKLKGKPVSVAYIVMTMKLMQQFGAEVVFSAHEIHIKPTNYLLQSSAYTVESDWTAASYWYAYALLSGQSKIQLKGLYFNSLQGDRLLADLFAMYGVQTHFNNQGVIISKGDHNGYIDVFDFNDNPDLVQTFAFMHAALQLPLQINAAGNLQHKETDRIAALACELKKNGTHLQVKHPDDMRLIFSSANHQGMPIFETYQDHRMAMSASIVGMMKKVGIKHPEVVAKSYPNFWDHLKIAGFEINEITD